MMYALCALCGLLALTVLLLIWKILLLRRSAEELRRWHAASGLPLKRFFNTSGLVYKELGLKDRLPGMDEEEQMALLATDGMLVKRPILVGEDFVLTGFLPKEWEGRLG